MMSEAGMCVGDRLCAERINPWDNPKLTLGQAMDIRIQEARKHVENLCIQKAKLEALNWLNHPYHEVQSLINGR